MPPLPRDITMGHASQGHTKMARPKESSWLDWFVVAVILHQILRKRPQIQNEGTNKAYIKAPRVRTFKAFTRAMLYNISLRNVYQVWRDDQHLVSVKNKSGPRDDSPVSSLQAPSETGFHGVSAEENGWHTSGCWWCGGKNTSESRLYAQPNGL